MASSTMTCRRMKGEAFPAEMALDTMKDKDIKLEYKMSIGDKSHKPRNIRNK